MGSFNYCQRCRVYVDRGDLTCPLCRGALIHREQDLPFYSKLPPTAQEREEFWEKAPHVDTNIIFKRFIILVIFMLISSILAILGFSWLVKQKTNTIPPSYLRALLSLSYATTIVWITGYARNFLVFLISVIILTFPYLFFLDFFDGKMQWFYHRGLPTVLAIFIPLLVPSVFWIFTKHKGLNIIASFFVAMSLSFGLIDIASSSKQHFSFSGWSIIAAGVLVAAAFYCFYLHYHVKVGWYIDRIFHLRRSDGVHMGRHHDSEKQG